MDATAPAKDRFTSLDTLALVRELRTLGRFRVDKAFDDPEHGGWILTLRAPARGRRAFRIVPGRYAAVLAEVPERSEDLTPFARELRRLLSGAVCNGIGDPGGERYLELDLQRGDVDEPLRLAVELFGRGNLVVVRGERVAAVAFPRAWAHRTLRIGAAYQPPPSRSNPFELGTAELAQALIASRTDRVSTLAAKLAFGGPVAEELLARCRLSGTVPAREDAPTAAEALAHAVRELVGELGDTPSGFLYRDGPVVVDVEPIAARRFTSRPEVVEERTSTFSEAAEAYFGGLVREVAVATPESTRREELMRTRTQQAEAIDRLTAEVAELRGSAEAILANYPAAEAALAGSNPGPTDDGFVDAELGGKRLRLRRGQDPRVSAQALFEEMKRGQERLRGAREALGATETALRAARPEPRAARSTKSPPRRHFWFEQLRWFISSEGAIVLGGKDAVSNDRVVKRYLGPGDRYLHADLHGAPSVVIKHPEPGQPELTELTFREAGQFGLAFSKAWRAGRASGDAYWVEADQVSKTGGTGEFVARGAWVIQGTRHLMRDLPLELGVGTIRYEDVELWSVAPPSALRSRGTLRAVLVPGEERTRDETERALAVELELGRGLLQPLLPAGGLSFRRA
ncbi:MAG TPA: NFACT family protein [Thermoplasmata archaeon]|nr:NFACT family protein [Thermoplasmata archaeon]